MRKESSTSKKSKIKTKKCNPYKNGPAEYKTVEYIKPNPYNFRGEDKGTKMYYNHNRLDNAINNPNEYYGSHSEAYYPQYNYASKGLYSDGASSWNY